MKALLFFLFSLSVSADGDSCRRDCEVSGLPTGDGITSMRDIREKVTGECTEVREIVVTPPQPDDPCTIDNIDGALYHDDRGGQVSRSDDVDPAYVPGGTCRGRVVENICYLPTNKIYAPGGAARFQRDPETGGVLLHLKQSEECRQNRRVCTIPYENPELTLLIETDSIFDAQNRKDSIVPCDPANCYSITIPTNYFKTPGGYQIPLFQIVTVTRERDGSIRTRLYVNGPEYTSVVTRDGRVGENRIQSDLIGRSPDTFVSCLEPFSERRGSYFPRRR